jgi:ATP-dependent Clp protease protease subunit
VEDLLKISGSNPVCISFVSHVDAQTAQALIGTMANAVNSGHDEIHLMMSTPGGSVADGIAVYNMISALPVAVHTYNTGTCDSIGNVIFAAGTTRTAFPASRFMFHGVGFDIQMARFELKDLNQRSENIKNDQSMIGDILVKHTNLAAEDVERLFLEAAFLRSMEALDRGIVDEVRDINLPQGMPILQLIFQR